MNRHYFLVGIFAVLGCVLQSVRADFPNFVSGFNLTVTNFSKVNNELYDVIVRSTAVKGDQKIRILLPTDYTTSGPTRRYPVLYLLHGGIGGPEDWTAHGGIAQQVLGGLPLITIMPNGDPFGWYTNWVNPGADAPQNWQIFHNEQLVAWIDFNLRTVAKREGRAIAGLSMGGFGSIRYAEVYPQLYIYTASFSGALDLEDYYVQLCVFACEGMDKKKLDGPFGVPFIQSNTSGWHHENPVLYAESLRGMHIAMYTGIIPPIESVVHATTIRMHNVLNSLNIDHYLDDYGTGKSIGHGCDGSHDFKCWNAALIDVAPRMMAVLQQQQD